MKSGHSLALRIKRQLAAARIVLFEFLFMKTVFACKVIERDFSWIAKNLFSRAILRIVAKSHSMKKQFAINYIPARNESISTIDNFYFHPVKGQRACLIGADKCNRA